MLECFLIIPQLFSNALVHFDVQGTMGAVLFHPQYRIVLFSDLFRMPGHQ